MVVQTGGVLANLKSVKLSSEEQAFITEYRRLEDLEREKGIKFFQCIGDEPHKPEFIKNITEARSNLITDNLNKMRHQDQHRFET